MRKIAKKERRKLMEELTLVRRMKAGDRSAFDAVYEKYHMPLLRSAYLLCGNRQDAEDVMQETFVACWLHIGELKREESFRYWLFRIMTRLARKAAAERMKQIPDENVLDKADERGDRDLSQTDANAYDRLLARTMTEEALAAIEPKYREVIVLYYYEEMSVREIAATLGIFEGTVKSRLYFARKKLKSAMRGDAGATTRHDDRETVRRDAGKMVRHDDREAVRRDAGNDSGCTAENPTCVRMLSTGKALKHTEVSRTGTQPPCTEKYSGRIDETWTGTRMPCSVKPEIGGKHA